MNHSKTWRTTRLIVSQTRLHSTNSRHAQIFTLPDGRKLGFAEYGSPTGKPLLYFHGYPSSRIEAEPLDAYARENNIRVLALERPGFGTSTAVPNRQMMDWPKDVKSFADGIGMKQFAVLGLSGGGPFAVACAYSLPRSMLTSVGLFASGPPWAAGRHYMTRSRRIMSKMAVYWPGGLKLLLNITLAVARSLSRTGFVTRRIDAWLEGLEKQKRSKNDGDQDISQKSIMQQREEMLDVLIGEPFAQGTDAMVQEARILSADDWGFRLEDVTYGPIRIWHGSKDVNAPIEAIRYLAEKLPNARLVEFTEDTHYTMGDHINQAVGELMDLSQVKA